MIPDNEGFLYPYITDKEKCNNCNVCLEICPINSKKINPEKNDYPKAFAVINNDEIIRGKSTSGGVFHLLAEQIILQNGTVFGVKFDAEYSVVHGSECTIDGIAEFRGSKYVQSVVGETFKECKAYLETGKYVLYSGTPCQIGGLRAFLRREYENLFCVDLICMSVPSPKIWERYLDWQKQRHGSNPSKIAFRYKNPNWKQSSMRIDFNDGQVYISANDPFRRIFGSEIGTRHCCYNCRFRTLNRDSDITIADFWGIEKVCPEMDDTKGTSLLLINTPKGNRIFEKKITLCKIQAVNVEDSIKYNPRAVKSKEYNWKILKKKRTKLFKYLNLLPFDIVVKKYINDPLIIRGFRF
jgi:coenzyme F420-reducing hydrogenase beta subunit